MYVKDKSIDELREAYKSIKDIQLSVWRCLHEEGTGMESDFDKLIAAVESVLGEED